MRLTSELREQYISRAIKEIKSIIGIIVPSELLHYDSWTAEAKKTEIPIVFNSVYRKIENRAASIDDYIIQVGNFRYTTSQQIYKHLIYNWHWSDENIKLIDDESFQKFHKIIKGKIKIKAIEEWNELVKNRLEYRKKKIDISKQQSKMALDFDGSIKYTEIEKRFSSEYKLVYHKTKLTLHSWWKTWSGRLITNPAKYELKLKPAIMADIYTDNLYNKAEYEAEMKRLGIPL